MAPALRVPPSPALREWSRRHGFSAELVARWGAFYEDLPGLLHALERPAATYLRLNPLRGDPAETRRRLEEKGFVLAESGLPLTLRVDEQPISPGATDEYLMGRYHLQDAGSALAPLALEPAPGDVIADLCAAPGGKTIQTAALAQDRAAVLAFEIDPQRTRALRSNLMRCGVTGAAVYNRPAQDAVQLGLQVDKVLLDAPCTGEGVISRDPRRRRGQLDEFAACAAIQRDLVETAHTLLRPGGLLVYSTCTLAPEENELQVAAAVERFGFLLDDLPAAVRDARVGDAPLAPPITQIQDHPVPEGLGRAAVHALPHRNRCLGFFVARLRKPEAAP